MSKRYLEVLGIQKVLIGPSLVLEDKYKDTHTHTDMYINTMTQPGLEAEPGAKLGVGCHLNVSINDLHN